MFETIFHPSDFTETSRIAFCHALKIALAAGAELRMLHVATTTARGHHSSFPGVRETLEQWQVLHEGSHRSAVLRLGMEVEKAVIHDSDFVATATEFLRENPASLVVLASHRHAGMGFLGSLLGHSRAEPVARAAATTTLFIPDGSLGFVVPDSGEVKLKTIVIPVALEPSCERTINSVQQLVRALKLESVDVHLLHIGDEASMPANSWHATDQLRCHIRIEKQSTAHGSVVSEILGFAEQTKADLVAMTTDGHHGFLDALRGNTTEQVLRRIHCPLLAVTVD